MSQIINSFSCRDNKLSVRNKDALILHILQRVSKCKLEWNQTQIVISELLSQSIRAIFLPMCLIYLNNLEIDKCSIAYVRSFARIGGTTDFFRWANGTAKTLSPTDSMLLESSCVASDDEVAEESDWALKLARMPVIWMAWGARNRTDLYSMKYRMLMNTYLICNCSR